MTPQTKSRLKSIAKNTALVASGAVGGAVALGAVVIIWQLKQLISPWL